MSERDIKEALAGAKNKIYAVRAQKEKELDPIPWERATIKKEYKKTHGPYLYAYWKDKGKLMKKYIGKSREEYEDKLRMKARNEATGRNWTYTQWNKYNFIEFVAKCGSKIAQDYKRKFGIGSANKQLDEITMEIFNELGIGAVMKKGRVPTIDWAFRIVQKEVQGDPELKSKVYAGSKIDASGYPTSVFG